MEEIKRMRVPIIIQPAVGGRGFWSSTGAILLEGIANQVGPSTTKIHLIPLYRPAIYFAHEITWRSGMKPKSRLIYLLNSCQRRLQNWISLNSEGASAAQGGVLFVLEQNDGLLMGELAQQLDLAPSAVSGLIDRMQKSELLERRPCSNDGRAQRAWLTEKGRERLPQLKAQTRQLNEMLNEGFSPEELETVERWLRQAHNRLSQPRNA